MTRLRLKSRPTSCIPALHTQLSCSAGPSQTKATFAQHSPELQKENKHTNEKLRGPATGGNIFISIAATVIFAQCRVVTVGTCCFGVMKEIQVKHLLGSDGVKPPAACWHNMKWNLFVLRGQKDWWRTKSSIRKTKNVCRKILLCSNSMRWPFDLLIFSIF